MPRHQTRMILSVLPAASKRLPSDTAISEISIPPPPPQLATLVKCCRSTYQERQEERLCRGTGPG